MRRSRVNLDLETRSPLPESTGEGKPSGTLQD